MELSIPSNSRKPETSIIEQRRRLRIAFDFEYFGGFELPNYFIVDNFRLRDIFWNWFCDLLGVNSQRN